eukprot:2598991-Amphidinium_carterae.1
MIPRLSHLVALTSVKLVCTTSAFRPANGNELQVAVSQWLENATMAEAEYGHISGWDTSAVIDMTGLFQGKRLNVEIGNWDTSSTTNMSFMFAGSGFDQDIGGWNTSM